jgi:hypothetical protein
MKILNYWRILFLLSFLNFHSFAQTANFRLTKSEKFKVIQTLLQGYDLRPTKLLDKESAIFIYFFAVPEEVIALFPKQVGQYKIRILNEQDIEKIQGKNWSYYEIGPFNFEENSVTASIGARSYCFKDGYSFKFYRLNGKFKVKSLGLSGIGECYNPKIDEKIEEEIAPVVKTKKPNE